MKPHEVVAAGPSRRPLPLREDCRFQRLFRRVVEDMDAFAVLCSFKEKLGGLVVVDSSLQPPSCVFPDRPSQYGSLISDVCIGLKTDARVGKRACRL